MEEILLSIRRIIADDQALFASRAAFVADASRAAAGVEAAPSNGSEAPSFAAAVNGARYERAQGPSDPRRRSEEGDYPAQEAERIAHDERPSGEDEATDLEGVPAPEARADLSRPRLSPNGADKAIEHPLLSPETDAAVASAFNALLASRFARSSDAVAAMTYEMLRPMLKAWLDENLPAIVERLVRAEIERVVKGA